MDSRTTIIFKEEDIEIECGYYAEKPIDFYVVRIGDEDSIVSCGFSCRDSGKVLDALLHLLSDVEAIINCLVPAIIENSEKSNTSITRIRPTIKKAS